MMNPIIAALPLWLIRAGSYLVPGYQRDEWVHEWEAELHWAELDMLERGLDRPTARLWRFALGSLPDALWHRLHLLEREQFRRRVRAAIESPETCLLSIAAILVVLALVSGLLPATRDVMMPLPYPNADRIATVAQGGIAVSLRSGVRFEDSRLWRGRSRALEDAATYTWYPATSEGKSILAARVSDNFFALLGTKVGPSCSQCAVVTHDFWKKHRGADLEISGRHYKIAAVLDPSFWFLSRKISVWTFGLPGDGKPSARSGVVIRLRPGISFAEAQVELQSAVEGAGNLSWGELFELTPLVSRVRAVLGSFTLALALAVVIVLTTLHLRMPEWHWNRFLSDMPRSLRASTFFTLKTTLALLVILIAGIEFTPAASITMLGGTDLSTEPLSTWLFLMGCLGVLTQSIADQRRRCRVCLRRLGMAAHVGCAGSLLLDWAGTELVCIEGHGMLHVPEMVSSWREPEQWTALDESWNALFVRR